MINLLNEYELAFGLLPNEPDSNQVIYLESHKNTDFEKYVTTHLDVVKKIFSEYGLEFIYLPELIDSITDDELEDAARYYAPWSDPTNMRALREACRISISQIPEKVKLKDGDPAVVNSKGRAFKVDVSSPGLYNTLFYQMAEAYASEGWRKNERFRFADIETMPSMVCEECSIPEPDSPIDDEYDEADRMYRELRRRHRGWMLVKILSEQLRKDEVLSPIIISSPRKLLLPAYNNMEIRLTPATMAFYLLFLKYPEGIRFKELVNYRNELYKLYCYTTRSTDKMAIARTVDLMVAQLDGNQNIQRSRIKAAISKNFIAHFCEETAQWYYLDGKRGEPMKIKIAGEPGKVDWQVDLK